MADYLDHTHIAQKLLEQQGVINQLTEERADLRSRLAQAANALSKVGKAAIVVQPCLSTPYEDAPQWSPWTRFMGPAARVAYNLGSQLRRQLAETRTLTDPAISLRSVAPELEPTAAVLDEIALERCRQDAKWGEQNHRHASPEDTETARSLAEAFKEINDRPEERTWHTIALEEAYEAGAETDPARIRAELVQLAAVAVNQIEAIDRANAGTKH